MNGELVVAILALLVALASFGFAWAGSREAARAEDLKNLLGEKETVGFGALKLLRGGLPGEPAARVGPMRRWRAVALGLTPAPVRRMWDRRKSRQRDLVIAAFTAACLFERSDRALSLLFRVIEKYRESAYEAEFDAHFAYLDETVESMSSYGFTEEEFDPSSAESHLRAARKVLDSKSRVVREKQQ
jgi:hypothetical protein